MLLSHNIGTGDDGGDIGYLQPPVRVLGQVFDRCHLARRFLYMLEDFALRVDSINLTFKQRSFQRTEGQVVLVVTLQLPPARIDHGRQHIGIVVPVIRVREVDQLDILYRHAVHSQHRQDALVFLDAPPVVLESVQALGNADFLAFQITHPEDCLWRVPSCSRLRRVHASNPASGSCDSPH